MENMPQITKALQETFRRYCLLTTDEEKEKFWDEIVNNNLMPREILEKNLKEGLLLLSDQVDALGQKVKAHLPA